MEKKWYKSKTKVGAALVGVSAILGTIGGYLTGALDITSAGQALLVQVGAVWTVFGFRDLPFVNRTK